MNGRRRALVSFGAGAAIALGVLVGPGLADDDPERVSPNGEIVPEDEPLRPPFTKEALEQMVNPTGEGTMWVCGPNPDGSFTVVEIRPAPPDAKPNPDAGPVILLPGDDCPAPGS